MKRKLHLIHLACLCVFWEVECMCTRMEKPEVNIVFWKPFLHFIFWRQFVFWNLDLIILAQLTGLLEILLFLCPSHWDYMYLHELRSLLCWYALQQTFPSGNTYLNPSLISFNSPLASAFMYDLMFAWLLGKTIGIFAEHHKTSASSNPKAKMR